MPTLRDWTKQNVQKGLTNQRTIERIERVHDMEKDDRKSKVIFTFAQNFQTTSV